MRTMTKRGLAVLLCLCMCAAMITALPLTASATVTKINTDTTEELARVMPGGGHVVKYRMIEDVATQDYGTFDIVELDVGGYNVQDVQTYLFKLKYNTDQVSPIVYLEGDTDGLSGMPIEDSQSLMNSLSITASLQSESVVKAEASAASLLKGTNWVTDAKKNAMTTYFAPFNFTSVGEVGTNAGVTLDTTTYASAKQGGIRVEFKTSDTNMTAIKNSGMYVDSFINADMPAFVSFGQNGFVSLYKLYFKVNSGQSVDDNTFSIWEDSNDPTAPEGVAFKQGDQFVNQDATLVGFPKAPAVTYPVSFAVKTKGDTGINGAAVKVYASESERDNDGTPLAAAVTDGTGAAVIEKSDGNYFELQTPYYYKVTADGFIAQTGVFRLENGTATVPVTMPSTADQTYPVTITVRDADTDEAVEGAAVSVDSVALENLTDAQGRAAASLLANKHSMTASKAGYQTGAASEFTVEANEDHSAAKVSEFELKLVPERTNIQLPVPKDKNGSPIDGAEIVVTKTSGNQTAAWGDGTREVYTYHASTQTFTDRNNVSYAAATGAAVPKTGQFSVEYSAANYAGGSTVYLETKDETGSYYSDNSYSASSKIEDITALDTTMTPMDDPIYTVTVKPDQNDKTKFTAAVTLKNLAALSGTFGLRYDADLFSLDLTGDDPAALPGFALSEGLKLWDPAGGEAPGAAVTASDGQGSTVGYHVFSWRAAGSAAGEPEDQENGIFDATSEKPVAVYTFTMKEGHAVTDISNTSFYVEPYDLTKAGLEVVSSLGDYATAYEYIKDLWRYTDVENGTHANAEEDTLEAGRLHYTKALAGGFYQAFSAGLNGGLGTMCDVITEIKYQDFQAVKASLTFQVKDESGAPLGNAKVYLYGSSEFTDGVLNEGAKPLEVLNTDPAGVYTKRVDASGGKVTYGYSLNEYGYWTYPKETEGLDAYGKDLTVTEVSGTGARTENVTLKTRVYHEVKLVSAADQSTAITNAKTSGSKYAYNGVEYLFSIKTEPGYAYQASTPDQVKVVTDAGTFAVAFDKARNAYVIPAEKITGGGTADAESEGFPGNPVKILLNQDAVQADTSQYTVTATAGENGTVSIPSATPAPEPVSGSLTAEVAAGKDSPEFVFTPNVGYRIHKVYVNGGELAESAYTVDESTFALSYRFVKVAADQNITVVFGAYDPEGEPPVTPNATEAAVSVSVGPYGTAEVTAPESGMTPAKGTVRGGSTQSYVIDTADAPQFTLTAAPQPGEDPKYVVDTVTVKDGDGNTIAAAKAPDAESYTFTPEAQKSYNVYVSFKTEGGESITCFVDSKVGSAAGSGSILPAGVQICNVGDAPEFTLTAGGDDWKTGSVKVNSETSTLGRKASESLQIPPVSVDTTVTAYFEETAYTILGVVDLSGGANGEGFELAPLSGATVVFTRQSDKKEVAVWTGSLRKNAGFTVDLPQGVWDVKVSKQGYLNYLITGFEVTPETNQYFGAPKDDKSASAAKPIELTVGDTSGKGIVVSFSDAGVVANGLRKEAAKPAKELADVNNDGVTTIPDMTYIKNNYGKFYLSTSYDDFSSGWSGSV